TTPALLAWRRDGASAVGVAVRYTGVPAHRYLLFRPGARFQRVASSAAPRTLATSATTPALSTPRLSTRVNRQTAVVGQHLVDAVQVTGTAGVLHEGEWELLGPVAPDADLRCRRARWTGAPVAGRGTFTIAGDGTVRTGRTRVRQGGCYTYRERLIPSSRSLGVPWTRPGLVEETSLVGPRRPAVPAHPHVDTGGRASTGGRVTAPQGRARVVVPSAHIAAGLSWVAFHGSTLSAPRRRSGAGMWDGSVPLSSLVGTTLLTGHVSDARDRPGAFHGLRRARTGQRITTTDAAGVVRHWRVLRTVAVDRRRVPRTLFQQGIARRLVLVTCTGRVSLPGGGFHYRKNLVVEAEPW
ncbi:MAG TPA: class F sortase, partial [Nocardioides sp.]|nr:class F sortase [Nocardioides sp.]